MRAVLTFEFDSLDEVADFLARQSPEVKPVEVSQAPQDGQKDAPPKRAGRPRKTPDATPAPAPTPAPTPAETPDATPDATPAPAPTPAPTPAETPAPAQTPVEGLKWAATFDGSRDALREVFNLKGAAVATELLKEFNAARISDVKPMDYAKFVTHAAKLLG